ncbi:MULTISPECIES: hypothetical protein [unclassified Rhizobium]|jgi:hypothetical protein|uniref:hypothetical protein n=1 Tax=unclassified Rhizobium TaxID=2613769 RepID=UPI0006486255|nr:MULTISPECIES: hypothetical protein [unclassified Rhizobium]NKJ04118.1 hypothetical protein [Rhizobium sp. SG741]NKJ38804.1 hypothetical protein [Rhizobium sp. SG570]
MKLFSNIAITSFLLALLSSCGAFDPPIVTACEENLKPALVVPSSYERNSFIPGERPATRAELDEAFRHPDLKKFYLKEFDRGALKPVIYTGILNFSALNRNADHVTTTVTCRYFSTDGSTSQIAIWSVVPSPVDASAFSQIIRDIGNDPPPTPAEELRYSKPIAPYAGWIRDQLRRVFG